VGGGVKILKLTGAHGKPVLIPLHHVAYVSESTFTYEGNPPKSIVFLVGAQYIAVMEPPAVVARKMKKLGAA
jgi:hypothetical protein